MNPTITIWNPELDWHNPEDLTPAQVGPAHRLLLRNELAAAFGMKLQMWLCSPHNEWVDVPCQSAVIRTYRVDLTLPQIVVPLEFPPLPQGEQWNNPNNLTADQVGAGYRLLLLSEVINRPSINDQIEMWIPLKCRWSSTGWWGQSKEFTFRVPLASWPLPQPKRLVPLEMSDVSPGLYFVTHDPTTGWQMICEVSEDWFTVVYGTKTHRIRWHEAAEHYKWTTIPQDDQSWRPMSKESVR